MNGTNAALVNALVGRRVLVIGDAMLDSYLSGAAERLCREAPVPIVSVAARDDAPGGAANAAANVSSLGGEARLLTVVGDDTDAERLRAALAASGVPSDELLADPERGTLLKQRVAADGHLLLRFDDGSTEPVRASIEARLIERLGELHSWCEAVLISDYGYGVLADAVLHALAQLQGHSPRPLVVDAKVLDRYRQLSPTAVKPNYVEAASLLGERQVSGIGARADQMARHADRLLALCGADLAAVTLDSEGSLLLERGSAPYRTYARPSSNSRAAGAGDTFAACLTLALAAGADGPAAAELSSAAAAVAVGKQGTATCTADELVTYLNGASKQAADQYQLAQQVALARGQGRRIVFTNGCFDILHRGHVTYLNRAKELGEVLIVGLNSDRSVERLKGRGRPINPLEDRAQVLAALSCVDHIVPFDDDTPVELIRLLRPDVFVKGGDYTVETLPEAPLVRELGGEVQILSLVEDRSTSHLIERIGSSYAAASVPAPAWGGRR
jgi:D-beta-D-heptose 7-phosphate kinase / D-beta-D-heptose 1-phosphate adenosyltransferase